MNNPYVIYIEQYKYKGVEMQIGYLDGEAVQRLIASRGKTTTNGLQTISLWTITLHKPYNQLMTDGHIASFVKGRRINN